MTEPSPTAQVSPPTEQILFHVRLIDLWPCPSPLPQGAPQFAPYSFFGLELELRGQIASPNGQEATSLRLNFDVELEATQLAKLQSMGAPFELVVQSKMPTEIASDAQKLLLQLLVPVQLNNQLARINRLHIHHCCKTGLEVFTELQRVLRNVSIARPFELTFLRHNHTQAAAKIRPFAAREDVRQAQVAQFQKLQADESSWSEERKRRKQFVLQQIDFCRERYLYNHVGSQLQRLHETIMGGGQWHAYEFEKALWYYHAPTSELYAEHPMRNSETTRQLIGGVQLRTRIAARQLQRATRRFLRLNRAATAATQRLLDVVSDELLRNLVDIAWGARIAAVYVERLKATTTKAAKLRKLWSKWSQRKSIPSEPPVTAPADLAPPVTPLKPTSPPDTQRPDWSEEDEKMAELAVRALLERSCDEILNAAGLAAYDQSITQIYVEQLKSNTTKAAKAKKLWEEWARAAKSAVETTSPSSSSSPRKEPLVTTTTTDEQDPTADNSPLPPLACVERMDPEPQASTPSPTTQLPTLEPELAADASEGTTLGGQDDDKPKADDSNKDEDKDDNEVPNWRGQLRLLKKHQRERSRSPKKARPVYHSRVVPPRSPDGPMLVERSSLLLDVTVDGPYSGIITSLRATKRTPRLDQEIELPVWRRDGSLRSFHAFFTVPSPVARRNQSPRLPNLAAADKPMWRAQSPPSPKLPAVGFAGATTLPAPVMTRTYGPRADASFNDSSAKQALSPPKKLPYIRRRKR